MFDALKEMRRLIRSNGKAIIVVGRESNVRGISFRNGELVATITLGGAGFELEMRQERGFKNKFGETIYEDILHLAPNKNGVLVGEVFARSIAEWILQEASQEADEDIQSEVQEAKERATIVPKSPIFKASLTPRKRLGLLKEQQEGYF